MAANAPLQSISITRVENRALPTPHVVYAILVALPTRSWTVYRRYSEFVSLHQALIEAGSTSKAPPAALPPKHTARRTFNAITGLGGLLPQSENAKETEEGFAKERRGGLETYLRAIVGSKDSSWREADAFKAFIELPKDQPSLTSSSPAAGVNRYVPGSFSRPYTNGSQSEREGFAGIASSQGMTTRVLGVKAPAQETEATRRLDEAGLYASQQVQMDAQDSQLDGLAAVLRRQRAMGLAINQELLEQSELLETLDQEVGQTQGKMRGAERQMKKLEH